MKTKFEKLAAIMKRLRSKNGCPWDRKQTHKTLLPYLLEESYELIEAINKKDKKAIREELGDVLLQVVFHAQIASEKSGYGIDDVIDGINTKLISRHPHVFAGKKGITRDFHVREIWEKNKKETKKRDSVIDGVPKALPALLRARRLQSKVTTTGFKWKAKKDIMKKVAEEMSEVKGALRSGNKKHIEEEIGDLIFTLVALSYFLRIDPENALQKTNDKFIKRFKRIEKDLYPGISMKSMLELWNKAKTN